jgi:multidrug resistance efflux pump
VTGGAQSPQEVLEAVRRLEADLESIRARARERERDLSDLRAGIAADAARERQQIVEDMERLVDLIGASWESTHRQIAALAGEVAGLRTFAEQATAGLRGARLELQLAPAAGNGGSEAN